jgi:hypothetical protein
MDQPKLLLENSNNPVDGTVPNTAMLLVWRGRRGDGIKTYNTPIISTTFFVLCLVLFQNTTHRRTFRNKSLSCN